MGRWPPNFELVDDHVPGSAVEHMFRIHLDTVLDSTEADQARTYLDARDADGLKTLLLSAATRQGIEDPASLALINAINFETT